MKYLMVLLILIGYTGIAFADHDPNEPHPQPESNPIPEDFEQISLVEAYENIKDNRRVIPKSVWNVHDVILDGTIIDIENKTWRYDIKVNQVFKGKINSDMLSVDGFEVWNDFEKGGRILFYLYDAPYASIHRHVVKDYSVKTSDACDARSLIQISPILPNDPNQIVRGHPIIPANWSDPCVPDYYDFDPDFFNGREPVPPKMQLRHNIPLDLIRCYDDKELIFKIDGTPACVSFKTKETLIHRGWALGKSSHFQEIVEQLRREPQDISFEHAELIKSLVILDPIVSDFLKDTTWDYSCCGYLSVGEDNPNYKLVINFFDHDKQKQLSIVFDLNTLQIEKRDFGNMVQFQPFVGEN